MRRNVPAMVAGMAGLLMLAAAGCNGDGSGQYGTTMPPDVTPNTVVMTSGRFSPSSLTITSGTTITWRNQDVAVHTSTSESGAWDTGNMSPGATRTTRFNTPGTYNYYCTYHRAMGMTGTITVQ